MANLYITEQGAWIKKTGDRIVVEKAGEELLEVPCLKIDTVLIYGNVQFTTQALVEMLDHGIELAILTLSGRLRGQLTPPHPKNLPLRMAQYERYYQEAFRLELGRALVRGKINNSLAVLRRHRRNHPQSFTPEELRPIERTLDQVEEASSTSSLRGIEGTAARRYFELLGRAVPETFTFEGRNRRPPRDPVNALLSFGYVLVSNTLQALLDALGFDPYLGFYHEIAYGRPSLALDVLEEFRPALVDRFTLSLLNRQQLVPEDFIGTPERGVSLDREGKSKYFTAYNAALNGPFTIEDGTEASFVDLMRRQCERIGRTLKDGEPYRPFALPC